jgi:hypothetical protein
MHKHFPRNRYQGVTLSGYKIGLQSLTLQFFILRTKQKKSIRGNRMVPLFHFTYLL